MVAMIIATTAVKQCLKVHETLVITYSNYNNVAPVYKYGPKDFKRFSL